MFDRLRALVSLEENAQRIEQEEAVKQLSKKQLRLRGVALFNLTITSRRTGLGGKLLLDLSHVGRNDQLDYHVLRNGDVVQLECGGKSENSMITGVVIKVQQGSISVAIGDERAMGRVSDSQTYRLLRLANDVAFKRWRYAMDETERRLNKGSNLLNLLYGSSSVGNLNSSSSNSGALSKMEFINSGLNESQKEAVRQCMMNDSVSVIHGPPGTGKTMTVVELLLQLLKEDGRRNILVCGPSNLSVDNVLERALMFGDGKTTSKFVRVGHPARVLDHLHDRVLDHLLCHSAGGDSAASLLMDIRKEIQDLLKGSSSNRYQEVRLLRKELKEREEAFISSLLTGHGCVVFSTLNMLGSRLLSKRNPFDVVIIDEAAQAVECEVMLAMLLARERVTLAGDHQQLPPTVTCPEAERELGVSLLERLAKRSESGRGGVPFYLLNVQYRMHRDIMLWSSMEFYGNKLIADESVAEALLANLNGVEETENTDVSIIFMDTAGAGFVEQVGHQDESSKKVSRLDVERSKCNPGEVDLIIDHVNRLMEAGVCASDMAIITPYSAQVSLLMERQMEDLIPRSVEIGTVDGFQGREKMVILFSFVRSGSDDIGFLSEVRRTNVALTRAKRHLFMVGDGETLGKHLFYRRLMAHVEKHGEVRSALCPF